MGHLRRLGRRSGRSFTFGYSYQILNCGVRGCFELPDGTTRGEVQAHIAELTELGVPGPTTTPALYPVCARKCALTPFSHRHILQPNGCRSDGRSRT
ncbi:DUF2848 family protein [Arthrobacter sp. NPDC093139]|uniref:DUF2848 family protein n=1 Tax=Arthrobacter sp. NPDC093139 TaxID=3363945 RepID=UPI003820CE33